MNQLIEDLLEYSRLERSHVIKEKIMILDLIAAIVSNFEEQTGTGKLKIKTDSCNAELIADLNGLKIALRNLVENAIKFSAVKPDSEVQISVCKNGKSWIISVRDNGVGFDMRYSHKIFVIFQRLYRAEEFPGTGIGLVMVSKAMQKMKGRVWAESTAGKGSVFFVERPKK